MKKTALVDVPLDELRKERYAVLLRGVVLGLREVGVNGVELKTLPVDGSSFRFEVVKTERE